MNPSAADRKYVLGYPVDLYDEKKSLELIRECWDSNRGLHIVTLNAENLMSAENDARLKEIVHKAGLVIPDGAGIVMALKLDGYKTPRLPGIELAHKALKEACINQIDVALLGAAPEIMNQLQIVLQKEMPKLKTVFCRNGYFKPEERNSLIAQIKDSGAKLVLIALGVPKQEYFIEEALALYPNAVFIGVGGSFDVWSGKTKRAPKIWQNCHLEWFYRLISEPWRFNRMMTTLPLFAYRAIIESIKKRFSN